MLLSFLYIFTFGYPPCFIVRRGWGFSFIIFIIYHFYHLSFLSFIIFIIYHFYHLSFIIYHFYHFSFSHFLILAHCLRHSSYPKSDTRQQFFQQLSGHPQYGQSAGNVIVENGLQHGSLAGGREKCHRRGAV